MHVRPVPLSASTKNIRQDYLSGAQSLSPFYQYAVQNPDFKQVIADKSKQDVDRETLVSVIRQQYEGLETSELTQRNIDLLLQPSTFTITTGHQLCLMGGPMFTTYKVLSTIKLAEQLSSAMGDFQVVPIFWIHTEDHDFEEINHFFQSFGAKKTYRGAFEGMVGNHILTEEILDLLPEDLDESLKEAFKPGRTLADAYRRFMNELFGKYGIVMLDASDARLKATFAPVLRAELREMAGFQAVNQTSGQMAAAGYPLQISPREVNLFYLDETGRNRIVPENGHFSVLNREYHWDHGQWEQLIEDEPNRFSPNVSLRPLYQEWILPNLAYIGGWGELSYWLQLRGIFERFEVNFPVLLPRFNATLFTAEQAQAWKELGFEWEDIRQPLHKLYDQYLPKVWDSQVFDEMETQIVELLGQFTDYIDQEISPTLARSGDALKTKNVKYLQNLRKKAGKVFRANNREPFERIEEVKSQVQPDGLVQERLLGLLGFEGYTPQNIVDFVYPHVDPLNFEHQFLVLPPVSGETV
ncbi:bacillithiol biosynthesis cysteine-adding enzyme BshC [Pontibacter sp. G13]|uniref:bacillithiol biosynthesis cysteine-adding enzyme BshC n=1 Tax=Pontibacter sp. G13 TaxID=3074898 RepID=UPI00288925E7|nr:bacillithiol biosynthesis cysteine-adding enzyme BshC [Pontibacter sp. G13]WNJ18082.1 bacillithiol biosynthesis cysteine-adding enzyme BshC [Pontibacter sp. G13]